jgi:hypothetical protein
MFDRRLISAEVLKLRRRRGMLAIATLITLGIALLVFAITGIQHASDPIAHDPAGGAKSFSDAVSFLLAMSLVVGVIVGATAGTQDLETGVFRDLAATGRSRRALFGARVTGAWAIVLPILAVTMLVTGVLSVALAGDLPAPTAGDLGRGTLAVLAAGAMSTAMAVGLSVLVGSRGPVIGILLAFFLAVQPLLGAITLLGQTRQAIPLAGLNRIADLPVNGGPTPMLGVAIAAILAWAALSLGLGAWKTQTREI